MPEATALNDSAGLHLNAGPYYFLYSEALPDGFVLPELVWPDDHLVRRVIRLPSARNNFAWLFRSASQKITLNSGINFRWSWPKSWKALTVPYIAGWTPCPATRPKLKPWTRHKKILMITRLFMLYRACMSNFLLKPFVLNLDPSAMFASADEDRGVSKMMQPRDPTHDHSNPASSKSAAMSQAIYYELQSTCF